MTAEALLKSGREPDFSIAGLSVWIHGREALVEDYWDGNWRRATARCASTGSRVEVSGAFLRSDELQAWLKGVELLHKTLGGSAELDPVEPNLRVSLTGDKKGHIAVDIAITPDQMTQQHNFHFELDQSYLPALALGLRRILDSYPVVASPGRMR